MGGFFQTVLNFVHSGRVGRAGAVTFMGFPNIPDNAVHIPMYDIAEISIFLDTGGIQHADVWVILTWMVLLYDFISRHIYQ